MAKTGLEIIKALDTTAGKIAEIISKGHPPLKKAVRLPATWSPANSVGWHG